MKILIAYTSKHGVTAECARMLAEKIEGNALVELVDMNRATPADPDGYDAVVLGSSVRFGRLSGAVKKYIKANMNALNGMKCGVFFCCGFPDEFEEYVRTQIPKGFNASLGVNYFGGELKPKKIKGIERLIVYAMRKSVTEHDFEDGHYKGSLPEILPEHINLMADKILGR